MSKDNIYTGYLNGGYRISVMLCLPMGHGQTCPFHQESQLQIRLESVMAMGVALRHVLIRGEGKFASPRIIICLGGTYTLIADSERICSWQREN